MGLSDMIIGGLAGGAATAAGTYGVKRFLNWRKGKSKDAVEEFKEDLKNLADDTSITSEENKKKEQYETLKTAAEEIKAVDLHSGDKKALDGVMKIMGTAIVGKRDLTATEQIELVKEATEVLEHDNELKRSLDQNARNIGTAVDTLRRQDAIIGDNFDKRNKAATSNRKKLYFAAGVAALAGGLLLWNNYSGKKEAQEAFEQATGIVYDKSKDLAKEAENAGKNLKELIEEKNRKSSTPATESPEAKAAREKLENTVKELKDAEDARKKKEADAKAALPTVTSSFYTVRQEGDEVNLVLSQYGKERTIKIIDAKGAVNAINRIQQNDPLLSDRDYYNFEELSALVEKLEKIGDGKITPEALDAVKNLKSLNEVKQLADEGAVYDSNMEKRLNNYIQKRVELAHAKDEKDPSKIPDTKERRKMLLEQLALTGEPHTIEAHDIETAEKAHDAEVDALGKDYSKFRISPAPEKTEEKAPEKMPEKSEKAPVEEYAARLMPADGEAITPPVFVSSEPEPPKAEPAKEEVPKEPPKEAPKFEGTPYAASYRIEVAEGLGGMAKAYLNTLKEARTQYNNAFKAKQFVPATESGEIATLASMTDQNKDGKIEASELEEACNQLEKEMEALKKGTEDRAYEGKDYSKLKIEAKFGGEDYVEAKIEIPSIAQGSKEAARLDAIRELMKKTGNEYKFVNLCEQYNTTLAKDGKFNLEGFEKHAQKTYGDKK